MNELEQKSFDILLRKRIALGLFILFLPFTLITYFIILEYFEAGKGYFLLIMFIYAVLYMVFGVWAGVAKCPMCNKPMNRKNLIVIPSMNCVHCGYNLKYYGTSDING